ncbi:MAG: M1 family metallopeptidase [Bacteroidetes bacterium]|nr:M1 family metallopeptidase [Bacteroidota bacterium]
MKIYRLILAILILHNLCIAQNDTKTFLNDPNNKPREHSVDITNMKVEVSFDCPKGIVNGKVTHTFIALRENTDTLFFDAPGIKIFSVKLDGTDCSFTTNNDGLTVYFSKKLTIEKSYKLTIAYESTPKRGIYFIGWKNQNIADTKTQTRKQIWTQGQGIDNRHWIPMYDNMNDKFVTETVITFDSDYEVLSNGVLKSTKINSDKSKTWHYAMTKPHAGYLLMIAIDKYSVKKTKTTTGVPVSFWYYPEHPEKVEPTSIHTEKIIEFFESETGVPYPWESYSQVMVQDFLYGAMENTTATVFGDFFNVDSRGFEDRNYIGVNAHELAHQWFGDLITARTGADAWLQESFATYYSKIFYGVIENSDKVKLINKNEINAALKASETDNFPIRHTSGGTSRVYQKGSSVISMLRYVLGDINFKKVIKYYLTKHAYQNVETNDLYQAIQDVAGQNLDWFFEQWIYRGGEPHYKVSYKNNIDNTDITIEQIHKTNELIKLFKMPVNLAVYYKDGSVDRKQVWIEKQTQTVNFTNKDKKDISFILFDENCEITKKVSFARTTAELIAQLAGAANMIDRYDALLELKNISLSEKRDALLTSYKKEKSETFKAEIISQLANDEKTINFLLTEVQNSSNEIAKALVNNIKTISPEVKDVFIKLFETGSYDLSEKILTRLCSEFPDNANNLLKKTEEIFINKKIYGQNNNIYIKYLELSSFYGVNPDEKTMILEKLSSDLYEFRTRIAAMEALKRLGICNPSSVSKMLDAVLSNNGRLSGPAKNILKYFSEQSKYKNIIKESINKGNYTDAEKKIFKEGGFY